MTLQQIVDKYVNDLCRGKNAAQKPEFANSKKPRRNFYYDIKYVRDFEKSNPSDYDLLYVCVFNRERHLWLMSASLAASVTMVLDNGKVLYGSYSNFDELYDEVRCLINPIKGIGDVACYDIAVRIGFLKRIQVYPEHLVYYHGYLRESVRKLLKVNRVYSYRADIAIFGSVLSNMPSIFLEDFLCSMHNDICSPSFTFGKLPATVPSSLRTDVFFFK